MTKIIIEVEDSRALTAKLWISRILKENYIWHEITEEASK